VDDGAARAGRGRVSFLRSCDIECACSNGADVLCISTIRCCDGRLVSVLEGGYNVELSTAQKRKLNAKKKAKKRSGSTSNSSSPAASPARSTRTEGEDEEDEDDQSASDDEELVYGALARSCAAHVMALQRAGNKN
jgi:hypothetical protein